VVRFVNAGCGGGCGGGDEDSRRDGICGCSFCNVWCGDDVWGLRVQI
jgi:hypothetical protein